VKQGPLREAAETVAKRLFLVGDRAGVHVLPRHYYSSVTDRAALRRDRGWRGRASLPGIHLEVDEQLDWLESMVGDRTDGLTLAEYDVLCQEGLGFGPIEAQILHAVVRTYAPARVLEVGSGVSTAVMADAVRRNRDEERTTSTMITAIEPYPSDGLRRLASDGRVTLVDRPAQEVVVSLAGELQGGDLLFIDSTHTLRTGSELARLYLEVLPSLPPGVLVHLHDIYLPYLYSPLVLHELWDWQETALVAALLSGNPNLAVRCLTGLLHEDRPDALRALLPEYRPAKLVDGLAPGGVVDGHLPMSCWLESVSR
jgi:predicted O-methyltransferase YrrM